MSKSVAGTTARVGRAAPLPPPERRAAIVAAALPLVRVHGLSVTTKQVAEAACVAEGTIFSVFRDKDDLLDAVVASALDPEPTARRLAAIDTALPLEERVTAAVALMQQHLAGVWQLMPTLGARRPGPGAPNRGFDVHSKALATVFEPDRARLRRPPEVAARLLLGLVVAVSHPMVVGAKPPPPSEVTSLLLDGIRVRESE